jgi:hypothetical protein
MSHTLFLGTLGLAVVAQDVQTLPFRYNYLVQRDGDVPVRPGSI